MGRIIAIWHRWGRGSKQSSSTVAIQNGHEVDYFKLKNEQGQLDFLRGSSTADDHYLQSGDIVLMPLGGSGDLFAYAASRRAEELGFGTCVMRVAPYHVKQTRNGKKKNPADDVIILLGLYQSSRELFYPVSAYDQDYIKLRHYYQAWLAAMEAYQAAENRARQATIGMIFCSSEGLCPEGELKRALEQELVNDHILQALRSERDDRSKTLKRFVKGLDICKDVFVPIEGVGPRISAGLIVAIRDIRRFKRVAAFRAYLGTGLLENGDFPRREKGHPANWNPDARSTCFLATIQFFMRKNSYWGSRLRENWDEYKIKHPDWIPGKILAAAQWRTATQFTNWLYRELWRYQKAQEAGTEFVPTSKRFE